MRHLPTTVRSVRPSLSQAVRSRLEAVREPLASARADVEADHHRRLRMLLDSAGADAVLECGRDFSMTTSDSLVEFLATSRGPLQLGHRYTRIEPMFHLGHRTETSVTASSMTFRHRARLGGPPAIHESLLVCGATIGMFLRIGVSDLTAELTDARCVAHEVWPRTETPPLTNALPPLSWSVRWDPSGRWAETLTVAKHEHLRALIAANPERTWNLQTAAAALGASSRTLQRRLRTDGTTFGQTVVAGRLDAAAALLLRTSLDVTTIALACGFTDVSHLSSHFSRRFGEPPGRHRTRVRGHA